MLTLLTRSSRALRCSTDRAALPRITFFPRDDALRLHAEDALDAKDRPTFVIAEDGTYTDANPAAAELVGWRVDRIVGARIGSFTRHEDEAGRRVFASLSSTRALESRPDQRGRPRHLLRLAQH